MLSVYGSYSSTIVSPELCFYVCVCTRARAHTHTRGYAKQNLNNYKFCITNMYKVIINNI